jgi:hypothetical protein
MREIKFRAWNNIKNKMEYDVYKEYKNLMQYTGLKDKNGKEIYEGDIVSNGDFSFEVYQHDSGEWRAGQYCLWEYISEDGTENCWEVIDNIYENPNLSKINTHNK